MEENNNNLNSQAQFIDDSKKDLHWYNKNYFFICIILVTVMYVLLFTFFKNSNIGLLNEISNERNVFIRLLYCIREFFVKDNWSILLYNLLGFALCGFYIERKFGSFIFFLILIGLWSVTIITDIFPDAYLSITSSFEWFSLWGFVCVDYIFSFQKKYRNKTNILVGFIVLLLMFIRAGFYDSVGGSIGYSLKPTQLLDNTSHFSIFCIGVIFSFVIQLSKMISNLSYQNTYIKQNTSNLDGLILENKNAKNNVKTIYDNFKKNKLS